MKIQSILRVDREGGGITKLTTTAHDINTGVPIADVSVRFDQAAVRNVILDMCQAAGLPEPWKD